MRNLGIVALCAALAGSLLCIGSVSAKPRKARPPASAKAPIEPSAYCKSGALAILTATGDDELAALQQSCRRGDIIAISASAEGSIFVIGRLCDFSKAIVNVGGLVLCELTSTRDLR